MNNKTLTITALALAVMVIMAAAGVGCTKKTAEEPITETEQIETVKEAAPEQKEEEHAADMGKMGRAVSDDTSDTGLDDPARRSTDGSSPDQLHFLGNDKGSDRPDQEPETTLSAKELAQIVIDAGINGDARKAELGDRYKEVQAWIDANYVPPVRQEISQDLDNEAEDYYYPECGGVLTPSAGVIWFDGHMETYYNLDMSGVLDIMYSLGYSGDYWVRTDGCKMFGDYIMCACDFGWMPRGSVVLTSLGWAMVCDTGAGGWNWIDIATNWG